MAKNPRDEFPENVKRTVAERGFYICANSTCRNPTVKPHSDPTKSIKTGKACHIRAAASGGPRYDSTQTSEERKSIENAIWLCSVCSDLIDKDEASYPSRLLLEWKRDHETWIENGGIVPSLPKISLSTLSGLTLPLQPGGITGQDCQDLREHRLRFANCSDVEMLNVDARIQLPEPIENDLTPDKPAGVNVTWEPIRPAMQATIIGGGSVKRNRPPLPTKDYNLQIDCVPPSREIVIGFITSMKSHEAHGISNSGPFADMTKDGSNTLVNFIDGTFQFNYRGAMLKKSFFAPIEADNEKRTFSVLEVRVDQGKWKVVISSFWS